MEICIETPNCNFCENQLHKVLKSASSETLETINCDKIFLKFKKGEIIFQEGEKPEGFYFIKHGSVQTFRSVLDGKKQTFGIRYPADWLGFRDLILENDYNHSALALEDTDLCFVRVQTLKNLIANDLNFQKSILSQMATEWKDMENLCVSLGVKSVHGKLAELLIGFSRTSNNQDEFEIGITREVMASLIGTKTETLVRALSDFKNREWVEVDKNKIKIKNFKELEKISA